MTCHIHSLLKLLLKYQNILYKVLYKPLKLPKDHTIINNKGRRWNFWTGMTDLGVLQECCMMYVLYIFYTVFRKSILLWFVVHYLWFGYWISFHFTTFFTSFSFQLLWMLCYLWCGNRACILLPFPFSFYEFSLFFSSHDARFRPLLSRQGEVCVRI